MNQVGACPLHLLNRAPAVIRLNIDSANRVTKNTHLKAFFQGIERGGPDAVIGGQSADVDMLHGLAAQPVGQSKACYPPFPIDQKPAEPAVGLLARCEGLVEDRAANFEIRVKVRAPSSLDTMDGPGATLLLKGTMAGGMPVAGIRDRPAFFGEAIDPTIQFRHHLVAPLNGQSAAWAKIVLNIDNQESRVGFY